MDMDFMDPIATLINYTLIPSYVKIYTPLSSKIKFRVNYTPLPSKMLELHSPPLLC